MTAVAAVDVRPATLADREALRAFLTKAAQDENIDAFDVLGFLNEFALPVAQIEAGQLFVATRAWSIVGLASVVFRHDGDLELDGLLIEPAAPVETGALLCGQCRAFAKGAKVRALHAVAKAESVPLLVGWGFAAVGTEDSIQGAIAIKMRAEIESA